VATNGLDQEAYSCLLVPLLRQEKVDSLTGFVHGTVEIPPVPFNLNTRLVHPTAVPHQPFAAVKRLCQLRTVLCYQRLMVA
jgi:hypothetical protein